MSESQYKSRKRNAAAAAAFESDESNAEEEELIQIRPSTSADKAVGKNEKKKPRSLKKKISSTSAEPQASIFVDLFGDEEEPQKKNNETKLWSSLTRRVADGALRQAALLEGELFFDVRVYNTVDIIDVHPKERWEKASAQIRLQVNSQSPEWGIVKKLFAEGKKKFLNEAVFYGDKKVDK